MFDAKHQMSQADCLMMVRTGTNKKIYAATTCHGSVWDDERIACCMGWETPISAGLNDRAVGFANLYAPGMLVIKRCNGNPADRS